MLSEIYPGSSPKMGSTYWDQILEVGVISVSRRVLKRLLEFLEQVQYYACIYVFFFLLETSLWPLELLHDLTNPPQTLKSPTLDP
jgi:hypothetical protein